jgi:hypothetical protein
MREKGKILMTFIVVNHKSINEREKDKCESKEMGLNLCTDSHLLFS